jgi:phosphate-selective porin OprO/OprP
MTGALSLLFMERPLPVSTFSLGRRLAVSQDLYFNRFGVHAVFFTRDPNNDAGKYGASVRVITNPIRSNGGVAHLGFSLVRETLDKETRYRTRPESHVTNIRLVDTGEYLDVEHRNILGVELAGARGGFTARLEGFVSQWERVDSRENEFYGAYLELGHFLTGQEFRYRDGKFVRPQIENGARAWEVGVRVSWVDLDDQDVRGGIQKNLGFALNWYPRRNVRAQFNLIYYDAARDAGDENGWIAQTRIQLNW